MTNSKERQRRLHDAYTVPGVRPQSTQRGERAKALEGEQGATAAAVRVPEFAIRAKATRSSNTDTVAGLALCALALLVLYNTRSLERTALMGIGPGTFPSLVAGLLAAIGVVLFVKGVIRPAAAMAFAEGLRPALLVTAGVALFALLLPGLGLVPAVFALVLVATRSSSGISLRLACVIAAILAVATALVFVAGLALPFRLLPLWI